MLGERRIVASWRRSVVQLLLLLGAAAPAASAQSDTSARDTVTLPPIEVIGTILPIAGPNIASGIPARVATISRRQLDAMPGSPVPSPRP